MLNSQTWPAGRKISRVLVNKECFVGFKQIPSLVPSAQSSLGPCYRQPTSIASLAFGT